MAGNIVMAVDARDIPPSILRGQSFASSAIRDVMYLGETRELRITFVSGRSYAYSEVPQAIYDAFLASPSKGAFFNIAIRGRFQFHELAPPQRSTRH
jgi:hypothetical protein